VRLLSKPSGAEASRLGEDRNRKAVPVLSMRAICGHLSQKERENMQDVGRRN
jgi:hypothetical protein